jgi:hypothetical protein
MPSFVKLSVTVYDCLYWHLKLKAATDKRKRKAARNKVNGKVASLLNEGPNHEGVWFLRSVAPGILDLGTR